MSFKSHKDAAPITPALPMEGAVAAPSARRKRLATGGVASTFLGSAGQAALPAPTATLTGIGAR